MKQEALTLLDLNALVRRSLEQCLPDEYWIQAELSDVRSNATGHCYLEFVQKDPRSNNLIAKARGTIWNNVYRLLKPYFEEATGQLFTSGIKVLVKVTVQFHELYGYSLTVQDIDPTYTLGDMALRRREILQQLEAEGVLTLNKELEMPVLPQRIAVISSATAAGYGDFCHQLQHNSRGFFFYTELFPALMQGAGGPSKEHTYASYYTQNRFYHPAGCRSLCAAALPGFYGGADRLFRLRLFRKGVHQAQAQRFHGYDRGGYLQGTQGTGGIYERQGGFHRCGRDDRRR